jgi:hypothetical protein
MMDRKPLSHWGPLSGALWGGTALFLVLCPPLGLLIAHFAIGYWIVRGRRVNKIKAEIVRKAREKAVDDRCIAWKSIPNCN